MPVICTTRSERVFLFLVPQLECFGARGTSSQLLLVWSRITHIYRIRLRNSKKPMSAFILANLVIMIMPDV